MNQYELSEILSVADSKGVDTSYLTEHILATEQVEKEELLGAKDIRQQLNISIEDSMRLIRSGLMKKHLVGNEYRTSKKSFDENKKIVTAVLNYRDKMTITVPELGRILGLGKTSVYRLISKKEFKTFRVFGKARVDVDSFEKWYQGQFHYKKIDGEKPGSNYPDTVSPTTVKTVLGLANSSAQRLINSGSFEYIIINGQRRILKDSFIEWLNSQSEYKAVADIEEVERNAY